MSRTLYMIAACSVVSATLARMSIPATRNGYRFVDVSGIDVSGMVLPVRAAQGTAHILCAEDVACIAEAASERNTWLWHTNAPNDSTLYSPAPSNVLETNLLWSADEFFDTQGRGLKPRGTISEFDCLSMFVDMDWLDSTSAQVVIDTGIKTSDPSAVSEAWICAALTEYLDPATTSVQRISRLLAPSTNDVMTMYRNIGACKRVICGKITIGASSGQFEDASAGEIVADGGFQSYHYAGRTKDSNGYFNDLVVDSYSGWNFTRHCWVSSGGGSSAPVGRASPYSWTQTAASPYVVLRPTYRDIVASATLYLGVVGSISYSSGSVGEVKLGVIRLPLTKGNGVSRGGATCDAWIMPDVMRSSKDILGAFIEDNGGLNSTGFPLMSIVSVWCGVIDMMMIPRVEMSDEDD